MTSALQAEGAEQETSEMKGQPNEEIESFDFDFSMPASETHLSSAEDTQQEDEGSTHETDDFTLSIENAEAAAEDETALKDAEEDFDFNFDFDLEKPAPAKGKGNEFSDDLNMGVSDLTDMDEFETKIDLARAYIDMGDADAAKDIAEEVLEKGDAEQKEAAQAILDELK